MSTRVLLPRCTFPLDMLRGLAGAVCTRREPLCLERGFVLGEAGCWEGEGRARRGGLLFLGPHFLWSSPQKDSHHDGWLSRRAGDPRAGQKSRVLLGTCLGGHTVISSILHWSQRPPDSVWEGTKQSHEYQQMRVFGGWLPSVRKSERHYAKVKRVPCV